MDIYSIYKVTNTVNKKTYIGVTNNIKRRKKEHKYSALELKQNTLFYNAIIKYGWNNFNWEIIYQSVDGNYIKNVMENHFIIEYRTYVGFNDCKGYNMTLGGDGISSETMRQKRQDINSAYNTLEYIEKHHKNTKSMWDDPNSIFHSVEYVSNKSKRHKEIWDDPNSIFHSVEYKTKQKNNTKRRWDDPNDPLNSIESKNKRRNSSLKYIYEIIRPEGTIEIINNMMEYCKLNNLHSGHMNRVCNGKLPHHKGFKARKIDTIK